MAKAKGKTANIFVWIILGLLIVGLAGFGVDGFGGSVRSIGTVGDREIRVQDYARSLQQEIRAIEQETGQALSFSRAQEFGIDRAVLARLVTIAALENEAMRLGISAGDDSVRTEIMDIAAFRGLDGSFNREAYRFALQQEGWSEREFEDRLRMELARGILQLGVVTAAPAPSSFVEVVQGWLGERRSFSAIRVDRTALTEPVPAPTEAEMQAHYEANPDDFTLPEARQITYAWLVPAMLADLVEIDEEALREQYRLRAAEFIRPERRLVDRLVFGTEDAAGAARARLDAGEIGFDTLVAEMGLSLDDTDMGDVTEAQLGAAGAEVFALDGPGLAGPLPSPFGPALYRVNAILAAQEVPFEQAMGELREQMALDRARRLISDAFDDFEDLLAGGASLEDLARETDLELGTLEFRPGMTEGIAGYEAFREAAAAATEGGFPEMLALEDGGVFALRLDGIVPPQLEPFEDVVVRVIEGWEAAETARRVAARAEELQRELETGADPEALGLSPTTVEEVTRNDFVPGVPRAVLEAAFALPRPGARDLVETGGATFIVTLDAVLPAETGTSDAADMRAAISAQARDAVADDIFAAFARQLEREAGISLDNAAIQAVHAQFR